MAVHTSCHVIGWLVLPGRERRLCVVYTVHVKVEAPGGLTML